VPISFGTVPEVMTERAGLRERKKEATLDRLREVALELFVAKGFDAVSVDDIAEVAEVSKTTFYRYFPSKEDLLFGRAAEHLALVRRGFDERPLGESPVEAARHAFRAVAEVYQADPRQKLAVSCIIKSTPSLAAGSQANQALWEELLREEVSRRQPDAEPFHAWVVAAELIACVRAATNYWLAEGAELDLAELVDDAVRHVDDTVPVRAARWPSRSRR
jgi:AcrR family transcriptional regulator